MQRKVSSRQAFGRLGAGRVMSSGPPNSPRSEAAACQRALRENESCRQDARGRAIRPILPRIVVTVVAAQVLLLREVFATTGDVETWSAG